MVSCTYLSLGCLSSLLLDFPTHKPFLVPSSKAFPLLTSSRTISGSSSRSWKPTTSAKTAVAAVDSSEPTEKSRKKKKLGARSIILSRRTSWEQELSFCCGERKFMLDEEEHFRELLAERLRNYGEQNKEQDFWLVIEPKFLDKFPDITKRLKRPAVALVSTNGTWITFMKLRLDRVLQESYEADSPEEALVSNPVDIEFDIPEKWTAPYPKYEYGWWEPFLPLKTSKV